MMAISTPAELQKLVGTHLGHSEWHTIEQRQLDEFAALTGDNNWIHIDPERAATELPGGKTIAHGFFLLSLVPMLQRQIFKVEKRGKSLNYGSERIRFTGQVQVGTRIRLSQSLLAAERTTNATRFITKSVMEIEAAERPAFIAELITLMLDE